MRKHGNRHFNLLELVSSGKGQFKLTLIVVNMIATAKT